MSEGLTQVQGVGHRAHLPMGKQKGLEEYVKWEVPLRSSLGNTICHNNGQNARFQREVTEEKDVILFVQAHGLREFDLQTSYGSLDPTLRTLELEVGEFTHENF